MARLRTEDSYAKNLMADSGKILATDRPLPVQKARIPPSAYMRAMAFLKTAILIGLGLEGMGQPPRWGGRVIRNTFSRSNGAVHVRDTIEDLE